MYSEFRRRPPTALQQCSDGSFSNVQVLPSSDSVGIVALGTGEVLFFMYFVPLFDQLIDQYDENINHISISLTLRGIFPSVHHLHER